MRHMQLDVKFLEFFCTKCKVVCLCLFVCLSAVSEECLLALKITLVLYIIYKIQ
jgi:hypothetical protein